MDSRINVLVVDDAVVVRRMVTDILTAEPGIRVVGTAPNGRIALQKLTQLQPDILTLDIEMPELDGLSTLKELRKSHPHLPVIMFSTLTERGTAETIDALASGASDYVTKPGNVGSVDAARRLIREQLVPKIKALCDHRKTGTAAAAATPRVQPTPLVHPGPTTPAVVAIGASTGGPNALTAMLPSLPATFPLPILLVQHMPPIFTRLFAQRLNDLCAVTVIEAQGGETLRPGTVYVAPGDHHLVVQRRGFKVQTALIETPPENSCRPAADVLFRSVAEAYHSGVLGVVLTGMGKDGLRGCEEIVRLGGHVIVQDAPTSVVWGMPGFVAEAGLADRVLALEQIAGDIVRRANSVHRAATAISA